MIDSENRTVQDAISLIFKKETGLHYDVNDSPEKVDETDYNYQPPLPGETEAQQIIQESLEGII